MKKAIVLAVLIALVAGGALIYRQYATTKEPPVWDEDFAATIVATKEPLVFVIKVRKINPDTDKRIVTGLGTDLDCAIKNAAGTTLIPGEHFKRLTVYKPDPKRDKRLMEILEEKMELRRKAHMRGLDPMTVYPERMAALQKEHDDLEPQPDDMPVFATSLAYKLRIQPVDMPPGTYTVTPDVWIAEDGKDALHSDYNNGGAMRVPARNSMRVTIK